MIFFFKEVRKEKYVVKVRLRGTDALIHSVLDILFK